MSVGGTTGRRVILAAATALAAGLAIFAVVSWEVASSQAEPSRHLAGTLPSGFPRPVQAVEFSTTDGLRLRGWYSPALDGRTAIILLHPYGSNRRSMLSRAVLFAEAGYGVLLYDARASGESEGRRSSVGYFEAADLLAALRWLRAQGVDTIACDGWSQGGSTILMAAERLGGVRGVVLESAFDTMEHGIDRGFRHRVGLPGRVAGLLYTPILQRLLGFDVSAFRPIDHAAALPCPVLVMSGTADRSTWASDTQAIFDAAAPRKELWLVPGAAHEDLYAFAPQQYRTRVLAFLARCTARPLAGGSG